MQYLVAVEEFRGHRYHDELTSECRNADGICLRCGRFGPRTSCPGRRVTRRSSTRSAATVTAADTLVIMFTSGSSGPPKGVIHSHGNALRGRAVRPCSPVHRRRHPPVPADAVLLGRRLRQRHPVGTARRRDAGHRADTAAGNHAAPARARAGDVVSRLARPGAKPLPGSRRRSAPTCPRCGQEASRRCCRPISGRQPGARAKLFGMTEAFGPYCGYPADTDMPRIGMGQSAAGRSTAPRSASSTPTPAHPSRRERSGMIQIRGPNTLRGICRRSREDVFTADGYYPTGDLGHLDDDGFMFYHGRSDDMFKVSGATVYPSEVEQALRGIDGVENAFVTDVAGAGGRRRDSRRCRVDQLRGGGPKAAELVQGSDGVAARRLRRRDTPRRHRQGRRRGAEEDAGHSTGGSTMKTKGCARLGLPPAVVGRGDRDRRPEQG